MNLTTLCLIFLLFLSNLMMADTNSEYDVSVDYTPCIRVSDAGTQFLTDQRSIKFYNNCSTKLYINACVKDKKGNTKLYRSVSKVSAGGYFNIYTYPDITVKQVTFTAGSYEAGTPANCVNETMK